MQKQSVGEEIELAGEKLTKLVVVIYRFNLRTKWERISQALGSLLHRRAEVVPLATDRAIIWCADEREKSFLIKEKWIEERKHTLAKMENWKLEAH